MKRLLFLFSFIVMLTATSRSQVLEQGRGWLRLSQQVISSDSYFDSDSKPVSIRTNSLYMTNLSGEYGISNRLTAFVVLPVFVRSTINKLQFNQSGNSTSGSSLNSVGDAELGVKFGFRKKLPVQVFGFAVLGLPFGKKGNVGTETNIQTGDGEFNQLIGVQLLQSFSHVHISAYTAFNNRTKDFSNEIRYGVEAGYTHDKFNLRIRFSAIESRFNDIALVSLNGIFSNHREVFSPGAELVYYLSKKIGVFASADFIAAGRNTLDAPIVGLGVQVKNF